jgi:phosphoribosylaminoimidazole carboxylase PurE protein
MRAAIVMGSKSDIPIAEKAETIFREFGIEFDTLVISAHRTPNKIRKFATTADQKYSVVIAIAGLAAHLPGVIASMTVLPVIGVPVQSGPLDGKDALYSIVQMPAGIPVACVGIGNAKNAALLAIEILGSQDEELRKKMKDYRKQFNDEEI